MKKRILALVLCLAMVCCLAACGSSTASSDSAASTDSTSTGDNTIYVLTAAEDHGWTGSVATFAKTKAEELNAAGTYNVIVKTAASSADQISQIEDIVANPSGVVGVVVQPQDDTVESAIQQLIDAGIPYVAFDRIIAGVSDKAVSNVKGDNQGIGAAAASYFVSQGLTPGEKIYVYEGDTSSVTQDRDNGFTGYLLGEVEYDGSCIADDAKWTQDQIDSCITFSGAMSWSRSNTKDSFETLMSDASNADIKWFYTEDDELALGIIEALEGGAIDDSTKETFLANAPYITAAGGSEGVYSILRGEESADLYAQLGGLICVTYSPNMIQVAMQDMVDYLDGKSVEQDHVIACEVVSKDNVADYVGFAN